MGNPDAIADVNIHLRARPQDRDLIDRAAELTGANRSQFMLAAALSEAKNVLLDQTTIHVDSATFNEIMDILDAGPTEAQKEGLKRLMSAKLPWRGE